MGCCGWGAPWGHGGAVRDGDHLRIDKHALQVLPELSVAPQKGVVDLVGMEEQQKRPRRVPLEEAQGPLHTRFQLVLDSHLDTV